MSLSDSIFIFGLALIIFGPKKLPEIGRQIGKLMLEFRRASNEFKMQIEEELRNVEQADRQKQLTDTSAVKNSIPPSDAAEDSSEPLTVRPPGTGITESTDSPYKPVSVSDEATELTASEADWDGLNADDDWMPPAESSADSSSEPLTTQPPSTGTAESTDSPYESATAASEPDSGELKIEETAPESPGPIPYAAGEHQISEDRIGEDQGLQEQTTNHHG